MCTTPVKTCGSATCSNACKSAANPLSAATDAEVNAVLSNANTKLMFKMDRKPTHMQRAAGKDGNHG